MRRNHFFIWLPGFASGGSQCPWIRPNAFCFNGVYPLSHQGAQPDRSAEFLGLATVQSRQTSKGFLRSLEFGACSVTILCRSGHGCPEHSRAQISPKWQMLVSGIACVAFPPFLHFRELVTQTCVHCSKARSRLRTHLPYPDVLPCTPLQTAPTWGRLARLWKLKGVDAEKSVFWTHEQTGKKS